MRIYIKLTLIWRQNMHGHKIYIINIRSVNKYAHWGKDREFLGVLFTDTENEKNLRYNWHLNLIAWLILSAIVYDWIAFVDN